MEGEEGFHKPDGSYCGNLDTNPVSDSWIPPSLPTPPGRLCLVFASPFVAACMHFGCGFLLQSNPICIPGFSNFFPDFWSAEQDCGPWQAALNFSFLSPSLSGTQALYESQGTYKNGEGSERLIISVSFSQCVI